MTDKDKQLENALYFLLKDAIEYARLKTFGGYLDEHGNLAKVNLDELQDHEDLLKDKLARSAVSYFHTTTLSEHVHITLRVQSGSIDIAKRET